MAMDPAALLTQVENAYSALLVALADVNVQEYQMPDGRKVVRADFPSTLNALGSARDRLRQEVARANRGTIRLGRLSRPRHC